MNITSAQMTDLLSMTQAEKAKSLKQEKELKKACADFEGILLNTMFQAMKKTVGEGGIFGENFQEDMYESMFLEKMSQKFAEENGVGIGDALYRQLSAKEAALKSSDTEADSENQAG